MACTFPPAPKRATPGSGGFDIYLPIDVTINAGEIKKVNTLIQLKFNSNCVGILKGRSSLAVQGVSILGGVVDADYEGNIFVILQNVSNNPLNLKKGIRFAQILIVPVETSPFVSMASKDVVEMEVDHEDLELEKKHQEVQRIKRENENLEEKISVIEREIEFLKDLILARGFDHRAFYKRVNQDDVLSITSRGSSGFGSTGM